MLGKSLHVQRLFFDSERVDPTEYRAVINNDWLLCVSRALINVTMRCQGGHGILPVTCIYINFRPKCIQKLEYSDHIDLTSYHGR